MDPCLSHIRVFNREHAAYAAARAGVELNKLNVADVVVLQLLEHADNVFDSVRREVLVAEHSRRFSAGGSPADSHKSGVGDRFDLIEVIHCVSELGRDF